VTIQYSVRRPVLLHKASRRATPYRDRVGLKAEQLGLINQYQYIIIALSPSIYTCMSNHRSMLIYWNHSIISPLTESRVYTTCSSSCTLVARHISNCHVPHWSRQFNYRSRCEASLDWFYSLADNILQQLFFTLLKLFATDTLGKGGVSFLF